MCTMRNVREEIPDDSVKCVFYEHKYRLMIIRRTRNYRFDYLRTARVV